MRSSSALAFSPGAAGPLLAAGPDLAWQDRALCAKSACPDDWFPVAGRPSARAMRNVERTCAACPVRAQCLAYALGNGIRYGTWGGLAEEERRGIPRCAPAPDRYCRKRLHVLAGANVASDGRCLACKREAEAAKRAADRVARTGSSSPQSGRRLAA